MLFGIVLEEEKEITRIPMRVGDEYKEGWEVRDDQDRIIWGRRDTIQADGASVDFKGYGLPVQIESIVGNTVQDGVPTPDNPVEVQMVGDKTGNLFDESTLKAGYINENGSITSASSPVYKTVSVELEKGTYTLSAGNEVRVIRRLYNGVYSASTQTLPLTFTVDDKQTIYVSIRLDPSADWDNRPIMLNEGTEPLSYEPFGYRIPFVASDESSPVYLNTPLAAGEKLMKDGTRDVKWGVIDIGDVPLSNMRFDKILIRFHITVPDMAVSEKIGGLRLYSNAYTCTYNPVVDSVYDLEQNYSILSAENAAEIIVYDFRYFYIEDFKAGAAGIKIYYPIATPTTETASALPEVSTDIGHNTITVATTTPPAEITVKGHIKQGFYWSAVRNDVRNGLAPAKFPVGTILYDNGDPTSGTAFQVVAYNKHFDPSLTSQGYTHSMTLCELKLTDVFQFDAIEALLYAETEIAPGTYRFKIPNDDPTYGGNKSYYFTTTKKIPVGGQVVINWPSSQTPKTASTYSDPSSVSAIESGLTLNEWIEGESPEAIDLGVAGGPTTEVGTSSFGKMNHIHRARYGSNNYLQSGLRQYMNSDKAANAWWTPQTIFDRPYSNRTSAGKLTKLAKEFVDMLATPTIKSRTNSYFETDSLDGTHFTTATDYTISTDKLFLLSPNEVALNADTTIGTVLDYYTDATNTDRIKYRVSNGAAYYWWLRTPTPSYAHRVRSVGTSGALSSNYAIGSYGVAAACVIQ